MTEPKTPPTPPPVPSRPTIPAEYGVPPSATGLLPWDWARTRLESARHYWIGTVRPDGRPHAVPVWGLWVDDALYCGGSPATRWVRNLAAHPAVVVHIEQGDDILIVEGVAAALAAPAPASSSPGVRPSRRPRAGASARGGSP